MCPSCEVYGIVAALPLQTLHERNRGLVQFQTIGWPTG